MIYLNNVTEDDKTSTSDNSDVSKSLNKSSTDVNTDSKSQDKKLDHKEQNNEKTTEPIDINLNNVLILLHKRSKQELTNEGVIIYNGSFDEKDNDCKYLGPGTYFIRLMKMEGKKLPDKNKASELISQYIKRFSNNDIKINPDQLTEVLEKSENSEDNANQKSDNPSDERKEISESMINTLFCEADESTKSTETSNSEEQPVLNNNVIGYMISYTNAYGKDKGKRISWGQALLDKLFGNTISDLQSLKFKYRNTTINAGKIFKKETYLDNVIDANTIEGELSKIIGQDYPKNDVNIKVYTGKAVYNKLSKLNKKIEQRDSEKLGKNPYCITFTVDKKDPNYDQYSKDVFAGIISRAIGKQFNIMPGNRGNIDEDDIIYVPQFNMYSSSKELRQELTQARDFARLQRIFNSKNNKTRETNTNEAFNYTLDDKLLNLLFENVIFNEDSIITEAGRHTYNHINQLIDKIGSKNIRANKEKIMDNPYFYSGKGEEQETKIKLFGTKAQTKIDKWDEKRIKSWNKKHPDRKREPGYQEEITTREAKPGLIEDFFKLTTDDQMKDWVEKNFKPITKSDDGEKIVQAFWKALSLLPEKSNNSELPEPPQPPLPPDPEPPNEVGNFIFRKFKDDNQIKEYINVKNGSEENEDNNDNSKKIIDFIESLEIISDDQKIGTKELKIPEIDKTIGDYEFISWEPNPTEIKPQKDSINIVPVYKSKDKENPDTTSIEYSNNKNENNSYFDHDVYIFSDSRIKYENGEKPGKETKDTLYGGDSALKRKKESWTSSSK